MIILWPEMTWPRRSALEKMFLVDSFSFLFGAPMPNQPNAALSVDARQAADQLGMAFADRKLCREHLLTAAFDAIHTSPTVSQDAKSRALAFLSQEVGVGKDLLLNWKERTPPTMWHSANGAESAQAARDAIGEMAAAAGLRVSSEAEPGAIHLVDASFAGAGASESGSLDAAQRLLGIAGNLRGEQVCAATVLLLEEPLQGGARAANMLQALIDATQNGKRDGLALVATFSHPSPDFAAYPPHLRLMFANRFTEAAEPAAQISAVPNMAACQPAASESNSVPKAPRSAI
jgi:hypothetical protein